MPDANGRACILVVEDEAAQRAVLVYNLRAEGYAVTEAANGEEALTLVAEAPPDLIVMDWMMPMVSGLEVCRQLKARAGTRDLAILMLSARSEEGDKVRGLETGADDYVTKPYSLAELKARVKALLRRASPAAAGAVLEWQDITLDPQTHLAQRNGAALRLGPTEYRLLQCLLERPSRVFSREQLLDRVWGRDIHVDSRTVDVHIGRLRKALMQQGGTDPLRTVRGAGYALG